MSGSKSFFWPDLTPCRKCGGESRMYEQSYLFFAVECTECHNSTTYCYANLQEAADAWNHEQENGPLPEDYYPERTVFYPPAKEEGA